LAEQDEHAARYAARKDVWRANDRIVQVLDQCIVWKAPRLRWCAAVVCL
jgi:hypothetical protein